MSTSNFDLQAEWREACLEFIRATGINLDVKSPTASQIAAKLDELNEAKDIESQSKIEKAKRAVGNTMRAIQTIGTLLAQGAQMSGFGGPANVTMNCVSFFIEAGFAYQKIAADIGVLFDEICPIMERAELYIKERRVLGPEMELTAHRMLIAVVKTCQYCIGVLGREKGSKRAKAKQVLHATLFKGEETVQAQINTLATLVDREQKMADAVTVTTVKNLDANVNVVVADVKNVGAGVSLMNENLAKTLAATAEEKMKQEIRNKLGVDASVVRALQSQYRTRRERLKRGTCAWLKDSLDYTLWSDHQKTSEPVLILSGNEGSGKSYVMTSVLQALERRYPQGRDDSTRISVAHFSFTRNAPSNQDSQTSESPPKNAKAAPSVKEMLRTWACQIMENDTFYRKDVHKVLNDNPDFDPLDHLVQKLFLDRLPNGAVFYLVLDETHEMDEDGCSEISSLLHILSKTSADLNSLRIMMTANPSLQRKLEACAPSSTVVIQLEDHNQLDIQKYVESKAGMLACFQTMSKEVQELKTWVVTELPKAVDKNFRLAERKLEEINSCQDVGSVRQIIEEIKKEGAKLFDSIDKELRLCNTRLNTKQVRNVNALLLWVIYATWDLQVYELESILYVQEQHKPFQPLAKELKEQYSTFFSIEGSDDDRYATVKLKSNDYAEYFKSASKQRKVTDLSLDQPLSKGQIQVVQHFVQKLCEQDLYDKLGLAEFFDQKLSKSDVSIALDCDNAQARIVLCCLQSLAGGLGDEAESLRAYTRNNLTEHLKQVDLDNADPSIKAQMGPLIVKIFTNEQAVQSSNKYYWSSWAYNDPGLNEIARLLKSSAVIKDVIRDDKVGATWIANVVRSGNPDVELLRSQCQAMAKAWEKAESPRDINGAFMWWFGFYNKIEHMGNSADRLKEPPQSFDNIFPDVINHIYETEISPFLNSTEAMSSRRLRSLGFTFLKCKHVAEAIRWLKNALTVDPDDLLAHNALADAYAIDIRAQSIFPDWNKALYHKEIVIEQLKAEKRLYSDTEPNASRKSADTKKAAWLRELERYEESRTILYNLLEESPEDDKVRLELVRTLCNCKKFNEVVDLLHTMKKEVVETTNISATSRFLRFHAFDNTCHALLVSAFRQEDRFEDVQNYYRLAIKDCASEDRTGQWQTYCLTNHLASILFKFGEGTKDREEAITLWEKVVKERKDSMGQSIIQLCEAYLAQALKAGPGSLIADAMLAKIEAFLSTTGNENEENDVSQSSVRALLARYYRAIDDTMKTQETLRPDMELALKLLFDNDDENDWQGYRKLADALMDFGAFEESQAAWSLIQPTQGISHLLQCSSPTEPVTQFASLLAIGTTGDSTNAPSTPLENETALPARPTLNRANTTMSPMGPLHYHCDGLCGTYWTYSDDFYICCECIDVQFNEDCLRKLQAGQLEHEVCDPGHKFLHVPPWTIANAELARDGKVLVGESVKDIKLWLGEIKQAWNLDFIDATA
ncbi:hypothetical protein HBI79_045600 [Parastagonospora nodorum]|nr:hypothetical protein HBI79_045600 [Parastagonospora nodorum]